MKVNHYIQLAILSLVVLLTSLGLNQFAQVDSLSHASGYPDSSQSLIDLSHPSSSSGAPEWVIEAINSHLTTAEMVSETDGWAAAGYNEVQLYRYDGSTWQFTQQLNEEAVIEDIDMVSSSDGWAVGSSASAGGGSLEIGMIWHYDGNQWQPFPSPASAELYAIQMLSESSGWAVGLSGVLRYNGVAWEIVSSDFLGLAISAISDNDVWVVGDSGIYHYNGLTWQQISDNTNMRAISMLSSTSGWAVGLSGLIMHYDDTTPVLKSQRGGTTWSEVASPTNQTLNDVVMLSATDGWAVGGGYNSQTSSYESVILHYDGTSWQSVASPSTTTLDSIFMLSATTGWAVGRDSTILQYDGSAWQLRSDLLNPYGSGPYGLQGIDLLSESQAWAVGSGYNSQTARNEGVSLHYNGESWQVVTTAGASLVPLQAVDMLSATDVWAVGGGYNSETGSNEGLILHYDGNLWQAVANPSIHPLYGIEMLSATDGWIVGGGYNSETFSNEGEILHYDGNSWQAVTNPATQTLYDVDMLSATDVWAVGSGGTILHYNGSTWQSVTSPTTQLLRAISMLSATDGWAVGGSGTILHYDGSTWQTVASPTTGTLYDISMVSGNQGWAVASGVILSYDGSSWQEMIAPTTRSFNAIDMLDSQTGRIVGSDGLVLRLEGGAPPLPTTPTVTPTNAPTPPPWAASFPFYDGFEVGWLDEGWEALFTSQGAVRVNSDAAYAGDFGVLLDDFLRDEVESTSALVLTIALGGEENVELEFWWREFNDENHPEDGLFISDDLGATWHQVLSFNNGPSDFRQERLNLDAVAAANGLTLNNLFQIKFQFYDNHAAPNDGYAIDEVRVQHDDGATPTPIPADAYEEDDTCGSSSSIMADASLQEHTFHDEGDEDWIKFEATSTITYVVEARVPPDSNADLALELYGACDNVPSQEQDHHFAADVRLIFTPPTDGTYYLRLVNNKPSVYGDDVAYTLSVRDPLQSAGAGALILVAGKLRENDAVQDNIHHVTNAVYRFARTHGCAPEQIFYLASDMSLDGNGDGQPDVDARGSNASLEQAITEWAPDKVGPDEPLTLYLMDHGGYDEFYLDGTANEVLTPSQLDGWLDQVEAAKPGLETNVIIETCQSGSFIDKSESVSGAERAVLSSTAEWSLAYASQEGAVFSDAFIDALTQGMNLQAAFSEGASAARLAHPDQSAWLDDDGDGTSGTTDGLLAAQRGFACTAPPAAELWPPFIAQAEIRDATGSQAEIWAEVRDDLGVESVWAIIYSPSYTQPDSSTELIPEPEPVMLTAQGNEQYSVTFENFDESGSYRVLLYAQDDDELTSRPKEVILDTSSNNQLYLPMIRNGD